MTAGNDASGRSRRPAVLLVEPMMAEIEAELDARYDVHRLKDGRRGTPPRDGRFEAVVTGGSSGMPSNWFDALPELKIIAVNGVGTDAVDLDAAHRRGVEVSITPGVLADDVADLALGLMLAFLRRIPQGHAIVRDGRWQAGDKLALSRSPRGKTIGILGLGDIGRATAKRAEAFGMTIAYFNRSEIAVPAGWTRFPDPVALAEASDILVVAIAANASTENIVGRAVLEALGPDGLLVNVARGTLVDEDALIEALSKGSIGGACLDVYRDEPQIREEFRTLPNLISMPHQGSATVETRLRMGRIVLDSVAEALRGEKPAASVFAESSEHLEREESR